MSINIDQVRDRLKTLQSQTKQQDSFWKPTPGKHIIRIVPYKFNKQNPFIELLFHYNIGNKSYLSPSTFGRPDPIVKFAEELKNTGDKEDWKKGRSYEPKLRTFVPVVVRGKENEGVKFWGFGKTVYQELLGLISDPEYGDITDITNGHDITVEFKSAEQAGKSFPQTTIRPKPSKTKLVEGGEQLKALFETQRDILDIYKEPTFDELNDIFQAWLNGKSEDGENEGGPTEETVTSYAEAKAKSSKESKTSAPIKTATEVDDISQDLDSLFEN